MGSIASDVISVLEVVRTQANHVAKLIPIVLAVLQKWQTDRQTDSVHVTLGETLLRLPSSNWWVSNSKRWVCFS